MRPKLRIWSHLLEKPLLGNINFCAAYAVILFDKSLNWKLEECQLDLVVRFFQDFQKTLEAPYWSSESIDHSSVKDILDYLCQSIETLDVVLLNE